MLLLSRISVHRVSALTSAKLNILIKSLLFTHSPGDPLCKATKSAWSAGYPAHTAVRSLNKEDLAEAPGTQTGAADSVRGEHDNNRFQSAIHTQLEPDANSVESHIGNTEGKKSR